VFAWRIPVSIVRDAQRGAAAAAPPQDPAAPHDGVAPDGGRTGSARALLRNRGVQAVLLLGVVVAVAAVAAHGRSASPTAPAPTASSTTGAPTDALAAAARAKAKAAPMATATATATAGSTPVTIVTIGSLPVNHRSFRIVSGRTDLSAFRELAWRADAGQAVGDARCTQTFRFNASMPPGERPTTLLCWRTSATRSAYTLAVDLDKRPSSTESVALLDRAWNGLH
jgi:hypothetical protein